MVSKVQSLKLDTSVWSNEIVQVSQDIQKQRSKLQLMGCLNVTLVFLSVSCSSC